MENNLIKIGNALAWIGEDLVDLLDEAKPLAGRINRGEPTTLSEEKKERIYRQFCDVEGKMEQTRRFFEESDVVEGVFLSESEAEEASLKAEQVHACLNAANGIVGSETWFHEWQGTSMTLGKKTQIAYRTFVGLAESYFAMTNRTPTAKKAPKIENLLEPEAMTDPSTGLLDESAVRPLNVEFPALGKRRYPTLSDIGCRLAEIGEDFLNALETIRPLAARISRDKSRSEPGPAILTEGSKKSVEYLCECIKNKLALTKALIKEWDRVKRDTSLIFVVGEVNKMIRRISRRLDDVNDDLENEPWFNAWQGTNDTVFKRIQLIYKEYVETVIEFFKRTDEEHEKTKSNPDKNERVGKAPVVVNVLRPEALRPPSPG